MLNRKLPGELQKIDVEKNLDDEYKRNYSGKSFKILNAINSALKKADIDEVKLLLEKIGNNNEYYDQIKTQKQTDERENKTNKIKGIVDKIIDAPSIAEILSDNPAERENQFIDNKEEEIQKKRKKRKKKKGPRY